jgi:hypothetical protein
MHKKIKSILIVLPLVLILAACASIQLPWAKTTTTSAQNQANPAANMASQPVENKLALGTLNLEGTDKAVTADQAKTLLPLWKAVKSLSSSDNTSAAEMTAIYQQIQEAMSAEQVQAIKDLNLSQTEMQALMEKYGVQLPQGGPANPGTAATPGANRSSNSSGGAGGFPGGGPGGAGGPPPNGGGPGFAAGGSNSSSGASTTQKTPVAGQAGRGFHGGLNNMLVDPLIKLLEQRAAA